MALIKHKRRRIRANFLPDFAIEINGSDPLTNGIVFMSTGKGRELVSGQGCKFGSSARAGTSTRGRVLESTANTNSGAYWDTLPASHPVWGITTEVTILYFGALSSTDAFGPLWNIDYDASHGSPYNALGLLRENTGTNVRLQVANASTGTQTNVSASSFLSLDGTEHDYWVTRSGAVVNFYKDGVLHSSGIPGADPAITSGQAPGFGNRIPPAIHAHSGSFTTNATTGKNSYAAVWNRALSAAEIAAIRANPNRLIRAVNDSLWIPVSTGLPGAYTLTADSASFSLTGQSTGLKADRRLSAQTATFGLTGNTAAIKADRRLSATTASFAFTGIDAALTYSPLAKTLTATVGSFVLTGNATALRADRRLSAVVGSYALTANAANLRAARHISAQTASYAITGNTAGLGAARRLMADAAGYTITGIDVGLTKSNQRTLSAATASFAVTGIAATLKADRRLLAQTGQIVLTGQPARLARGYRLSAGAGAYGLTGQAAGLRRAYRMVAAPAQYAFTGYDVAMTYIPSFSYARAPSGPGYHREFSNTARPMQQNTKRYPR